MSLLFAVVLATESMVIAVTNNTYGQLPPEPGRGIPHWHGSPSMTNHDLSNGTKHEITVDAQLVPQNMDHSFDGPDMVLGIDGVDIVARQVPLPKHLRPAPLAQPPSAPPSANVENGLTESLGEMHRWALPGEEVRHPEVSMPAISTARPLPEDATSSPLLLRDEMGVGRPPLYGIISAIAASLGYALLMMFKCKGCISELAPKPPLLGFMRSHLDKRNGQSRRNTRKGGARFCPGRFNVNANLAVDASAQIVTSGGADANPL